jgi:hypothetical protein
MASLLSLYRVELVASTNLVAPSVYYDKNYTFRVVAYDSREAIDKAIMAAPDTIAPRKYEAGSGWVSLPAEAVTGWKVHTCAFVSPVDVV